METTLNIFFLSLFLVTNIANLQTAGKLIHKKTTLNKQKTPSTDKKI